MADVLKRIPVREQDAKERATNFEDMMSVEDSLIRKLTRKMDIEPEVFMAQVEGLLEKRPKVSGGQLHIDQYRLLMCR